MDVLAAGLAEESPTAQDSFAQDPGVQCGEADSSLGQAASQFLAAISGVDKTGTAGNGLLAGLSLSSVVAEGASAETATSTSASTGSPPLIAMRQPQASGVASNWFIVPPASLRASLARVTAGVASATVSQASTTATSATVPPSTEATTDGQSRSELDADCATLSAGRGAPALLSQEEGSVLTTSSQANLLPGLAAKSGVTNTATAEPASSTAAHSSGAAPLVLQAPWTALAVAQVADPTANAAAESPVVGLTSPGRADGTTKTAAKSEVSRDRTAAKNFAETPTAPLAQSIAATPALDLLSSLSSATGAATAPLVLPLERSLKPEGSLYADGSTRGAAAGLLSDLSGAPSSRGVVQGDINEAGSNRALQDSLHAGSEGNPASANAEPATPAFELTLTQAAVSTPDAGMLQGNVTRSTVTSAASSSSAGNLTQASLRQSDAQSANESGSQDPSSTQPAAGERADLSATGAQSSADLAAGLSKRTSLLDGPAGGAKSISGSAGSSDGPATSLSSTATLETSSSSTASKVSNQPESNSSNPPMISQGSEPAANPLPVRSMNLRVEGDSGETVNVRLTDRAGQVQITVHSSDDRTAASLRQDLSSLSSSLDKVGWKTELSTPASPSRNSEQSPDQQSRQQSQRQSAEDAEQQSGRRRPTLIEQWAALANQENS